MITSMRALVLTEKDLIPMGQEIDLNKIRTEDFKSDARKEMPDHEIVIVQINKKSRIIKNRYGYTDE